jgi:hypothetical protein
VLQYSASQRGFQLSKEDILLFQEFIQGMKGDLRLLEGALTCCARQGYYRSRSLSASPGSFGQGPARSAHCAASKEGGHRKERALIMLHVTRAAISVDGTLRFLPRG